jgi:ribosomal protein S18 acetylase RimI-like enzyme
MWRAMTTSDLASVSAVAAAVHPSHPEDIAVFAERLALYPAGCHVLVAPRDTLGGYVVSHPWRDREPPALNTMLGALPAGPSTYYIHDIALMPEARRASAAREIVASLIGHARAAGFPTVSLIAVNDSQAFWERMGFRRIEDTRLTAKLASYGEAACFMALDLLGK